VILTALSDQTLWVKTCRHSLPYNRKRRLPKTKHLNSPFHRPSESYSMSPVTACHQLQHVTSYSMSPVTACHQLQHVTSYSMSPVPRCGFLDIQLIKKFLSCLGVVPGRDMWEFGWTMWQWDGISTGILVFIVNVIAPRYYTLLFIYFRRYIIRIIEGVVVRHS